MKAFRERERKRQDKVKNRRRKLTPEQEAEKKAIEEEDRKEEEERMNSHNFGLVNIAFVVIVGIVTANYFGLFMPDNIPDFVVSKVELFKQFPSLAPPNETVVGEEGTPVIEGEDVVTDEAPLEEEEADEGEFKTYTQAREEEEEEEVDIE